MRRSFVLSAVAAALATPAFAGAGETAPWSDWFADPIVEGLVALLIVCYFSGLAGMLARERQKWPVGAGRVVSFFGAMIVIVAALLSPIDAFADELLSAHMLQHLLLMLGAAPLLALSDAHLVLIRALPLAGRRRLGRAVAGIPGVKAAARKELAAWLAAALFIGTLWFWHVPAAYDWALGNPFVHSCEHLMLLAAATFFWRVIVTSGNRRLSPGMAVLLVSLVGIQGAFLSALIMFAPHGLYAAYAGNPLNDQVLAGVLMCIPASFVYLGSTIWALSRMLGNGHSHVG